jgi:DNA-binding response OmpR family regulator
MSGYDEDQVTDGADLPTTAFLSKPFTPAALAARVAGAIGRGRNRGAGQRPVGPLRPGD